jgi:iron-sulfur cluster insertion protein
MPEANAVSANMSMTDSAARRLSVLREKEGNPKLMLRVAVLGGGCSGFQYELGLDDQLSPDDVTFEKNGAVLVTDATSLQFLAGAEVDYVQDMIKSSFKIRNPNEAAGCGCGKSFSPKM